MPAKKLMNNQDSGKSNKGFSRLPSVAIVNFGFWDKIKYLFSDPNFFFEKIKTERTIKESLLMYSIVGAFFAVVGFVFSFGMGTISSMSGMHRVSGPYGFFISSLPFIGLVIGIIGSFLYSGLIHALVIAFKGEGNYSNSYNVYAYSMIPYLILGVIPIVGFLGGFYSYYLMTIGISKVHNISKGKASLACLLPAILIIGLLVGLIIIMGFQYGLFRPIID